MLSGQRTWHVSLGATLDRSMIVVGAHNYCKDDLRRLNNVNKMSTSTNLLAYVHFTFLSRQLPQALVSRTVSGSGEGINLPMHDSPQLVTGREIMALKHRRKGWGRCRENKATCVSTFITTLPGSVVRNAGQSFTIQVEEIVSLGDDAGKHP